MNKNRFQVYLPILFAVVLIIGIFIGMRWGQGHSGPSFLTGKKIDKFRAVIKYVDDNYVDTVNNDLLEQKAIMGMLQSLDPHSVYISADEFHEATDPLLGSFEGIGVQFRIERDTITVINAIAGGPSEKVGIRAGDRIVLVDGKKSAGMKITNNDVMRKLKGKKGSKVLISVFRRGVKDLLQFTVIRDVIPTYSLDISYMPGPGIGYIRLNNFSATTSEEVAKALHDLQTQGMKKLILDLRGNGGGYLQAAINVADQFLPANKLIVYTKGIHHEKEIAESTAGGLFEAGELIVMIDEWSASASEIVAGAIQDNDRGTILGRRSFGKGLVQEQMNFKDGSAVRLTVARYYTPTGRCIQKPYTNGVDDYYAEYYHRLTDGEMENPDSIHFADSLKFKTPAGKIVYGGGGIMPDIFVPVDKDTNYRYYNQLVNKGVIYQFAFDYTDAHRKDLNYKTFHDFDKNFTITTGMYSEMIRAGEKMGVKRGGKNMEQSDERTKNLLKAYIGRNILDNDGFYPILNNQDKAFLKAVEVMKKGK